MFETEYSADIAEKVKSLPVSLKVADVADFLRVSRSSAYKLVKTPGFPVVEIPGIRRVVVSKEYFLRWYYRNYVENVQV